MALKAPPIKAPPNLICDWAELKALSSATGEYRLTKLKRYWDVNRESEMSDPEGLESKEVDTDQDGVSGVDEERFLDSIEGEFEDRLSALGTSYPFRLGSSSRLVLDGPPDAGGFMYLFCLFLTYANGKELLDGTWIPEVNHRVRDLFQACSTLAAAGHLQGCAISFGWPRPNDNPPFLVRLREVYAMFGEGTVVDVPRPGVSTCPKDEEIDVISWRPALDRAPGTLYMLAQVASGDNWMGKPLAGRPIESFHRNWFQPPPQSEALAAIFIPHAVPPVDATGTRKERLSAITVRYGTIFDRMRLPRLTSDGLKLWKEGRADIHIERVDDVDEICYWVINQIQSLQAASV